MSSRGSTPYFEPLHGAGLRSRPLWQPRQQRITDPPPAGLRDWLFDTGSLTRRVQCACPGRFSVEVLSQGWERPMHNEARRLGLRTGHLALVRQVHLLCDGQPWVFARTVIPQSSLGGPRRRLFRLGARSLGSVLFADPGVCRDEIEVCHTWRGQDLHALATCYNGARAESLWGRRSVFYLQGQPLLVGEVFMAVNGAWPPRCARDAGCA